MHNNQFKPWLMSELQTASRLWKAGVPQVEVAKSVNRSVGALKNQVKKNRELFPRRHEYTGNMMDAVNIKFQVTPFLHKLIMAEAKDRGISMNMLLRETFRDRFVRKLWSPPDVKKKSDKIKYFNGTRAS